MLPGQDSESSNEGLLLLSDIIDEARRGRAQPAVQESIDDPAVIPYCRVGAYFKSACGAEHTASQFQDLPMYHTFEPLPVGIAHVTLQDWSTACTRPKSIT